MVWPQQKKTVNFKCGLCRVLSCLIKQKDKGCSHYNLHAWRLCNSKPVLNGRSWCCLEAIISLDVFCKMCREELNHLLQASFCFSIKGLVINSNQSSCRCQDITETYQQKQNKSYIIVYYVKKYFYCKQVKGPKPKIR